MTFFCFTPPYQNTVQVGGVDDLTHRLDALDQLAEVVDHLLTLDDLGVAGESRREQPLIHQGLKPHHDWMV